MAGLVLTIPLFGVTAAVSLVLGGSVVALLVLMAAAILLTIRLRLRAAIARRVLDATTAANAARLLRLGVLLAPATHALHLLAWLASLGDRDISWAGRHYVLDRGGNVVSIARSIPASAARRQSGR
jgi:hypothetical protein